jgi:dienelactone hydrolase
MDLKGKAVGRPIEISETGEVVYDSFKTEGHHIRTIWHFPAQIKKPPVVFFLQGYICQSTDFGASPQNPAKKLIDDWVKAGYAVYRMEKAGQGDSISRKACMDMNFNEELELFLNGYEYLLSSEKVNTEEIYLFGHSMGATIAPMLANQHTPAGIITYGASGKKWADYMDAIMTKQGVHFGQSQSEIKESSGPALAFVDKYLRQQVEVDNLLNDDEVGRYLEENNLKQAFENGTYLMRSHEFWRSLSNLDIPAVWEETQAPVYSLHGTLDIQAINKEEAQAIVNAVNQGSSKATLQLIQGADHGFVSFENMEQNVEVLGSGQYRIHAVSNYHSGIAGESVKWMNRQRGL